MEQELIEKINKKCPLDQGIFFQPYGIPDRIDEYVVYSRYETGGISGGNCWNDDRRHYHKEKPDDHMKVLDLLLEEIAPQITFWQYRRIQEIIHDSEKTDWKYYGNRTDYRVEYILLPELEELLSEILDA